MLFGSGGSEKKNFATAEIKKLLEDAIGVFSSPDVVRDTPRAT